MLDAEERNQGKRATGSSKYQTRSHSREDEKETPHITEERGQSSN